MATSLQTDAEIQALVAELRHLRATVDYDDEAGTLIASAGTAKTVALRKGEPGEPWIVRTLDVVTKGGGK